MSVFGRNIVQDLVLAYRSLTQIEAAAGAAPCKCGAYCDPDAQNDDVLGLRSASDKPLLVRLTIDEFYEKIGKQENRSYRRIQRHRS